MALKYTIFGRSPPLPQAKYKSPISSSNDCRNFQATINTLFIPPFSHPFSVSTSWISNRSFRARASSCLRFEPGDADFTHVNLCFHHRNVNVNYQSCVLVAGKRHTSVGSALPFSSEWIAVDYFRNGTAVDECFGWTLFQGTLVVLGTFMSGLSSATDGPLFKLCNVAIESWQWFRCSVWSISSSLYNSLLDFAEL